MMKNKLQFRVGAFVVVAFVVALYVVFMIGSERNIFKPHYSLIAKFHDISGLRVGAPVQLSGLTIGAVSKIKLSHELSDSDVYVYLSIDRLYRARLRQDSLASINTQGLLGDKFIFLSIGSPEDKQLKDGDEIKTTEGSDFGALATKATEVLDNINSVFKGVDKFFASGSKSEKSDLKKIVHSIQDIFSHIEKGPGLLNALIYDPEGKSAVNSLSASLGSLKSILGETDKQEKKDHKINGILANLKDASEDLKIVMARIERGEGTIGGLIADDAVYQDLRTLFGRVSRNNILRAIVRSTIEENDVHSNKK